MKIKSSAVVGKNNDGKIMYEPPTLESIDEAVGLVVTGGSNIYDDENHEYSPDND